ncbi:MAG TPA: hypothetical protein VMW50_04400, partial [Dehalococcoidia bacterium]|nr:hypothetical protein [Dehalococcoidia bacterium]
IAGIYTADRWKVDGSFVDTTRQTFTVGQTDVPGEPQYYMRIVTNAAESFFLHQSVEDVRTSAGQTITLSFWAKAAGAMNLNMNMDQNFGTGGSAGGNSFTQVFVLSAAWQKFTVTGLMGSLAGKTVNANSYFEAVFSNPDANAETVDLAQVQIEIGDTATEFEHRSIGQELALCQRYYYIHTPAVAMYVWGQSAATWRAVQFFMPVTMRTVPTVDHNMTAGGTGGKAEFVDAYPESLRFSTNTAGASNLLSVENITADAEF